MFRCGFSVCYLPRSHCNAPWVVGVGGHLLHHAADSGNRQRCEDAPTRTRTQHPSLQPSIHTLSSTERRNLLAFLGFLNSPRRHLIFNASVNTFPISEMVVSVCLVAVHRNAHFSHFLQTLLCFRCRWVGWNQWSPDWLTSLKSSTSTESFLHYSLLSAPFLCRSFVLPM